MKSILEIFVGKCKNNNGTLNDIFLSIFFIGKGYYTKIREITNSKLET
jgi:hypothetical protein